LDEFSFGILGSLMELMEPRKGRVKKFSALIGFGFTNYVRDKIFTKQRLHY
jgi:hypothetical protein